MKMHRAGDDFLARAALTGDQSRARARRRAPRQVEDALHARAHRDDGVEPEATAQRLAKAAVLPCEAGQLEGARDDVATGIVVDGLAEIVERPRLPGGEGIVDPPVALGWV